jgi:hypothetical protein
MSLYFLQTNSSRLVRKDIINSHVYFSVEGKANLMVVDVWGRKAKERLGFGQRKKVFKERMEKVVLRRFIVFFFIPLVFSLSLEKGCSVVCVHCVAMQGVSCWRWSHLCVESVLANYSLDSHYEKPSWGEMSRLRIPFKITQDFFFFRLKYKLSLYSLHAMVFYVRNDIGV